MRPIRIVLADDHQLVRAGIRSLLEKVEDVEVVAEANNGREALELVEQHRPSLVLMDIMMREMNGLDATARITSRYPHVRVMILSMNATEEYVLQALRSGARGYLLKDIEPEELARAVHAVASGETYLTSTITHHVVESLLQKAETTSLDRLTPRQREVLQLVAEGNSTKQIAKKLGIGVKTAETHRSQMMEILDVHDVAGLVRYAIRMGVISVD